MASLDLGMEHEALERAMVQLETWAERAPDSPARELVGVLLQTGAVLAGAMRDARRGTRPLLEREGELVIGAMGGDPVALAWRDGSPSYVEPVAGGELAPVSIVASLTEAMDDVAAELAGVSTMGDAFGDIVGTPEGAAAWNEINGQLSTEGASAIDVLGAKTAFASSFDQLTGQFGVDPATALNAAKQFTIQAQTVLGAVDQVRGLIAAAQNPATAPASLISSFTGIVVSIAIAAGASAGVGGAIVAAVAVVLNILESAGWIPSGPKGATIPGCAGRIHIDPAAPVQPIVIGCVVGIYGSEGQKTVASAHNQGWRRFPEPSPYPTLGAGDNGWFIANTASSTRTPLAWNGGTWSGDGDARMVDLAWPQYHHLECEQSHLLPGAPGQFQQTFFAAWKLNRELQLNGQKAAEDWQVLAHTIAIWNRAHAPGTPYTFAQKGTDTDFMPAGTDCAQYPSFGPYVAYLAQDLAQKGGAGQPSSVTINTGPAIQRPVGSCALYGKCGSFPHCTACGGASSSSSSTSTGTKVAVGAVVTGGLLTAAWLALGRPLAWEAVKSSVKHLFARSA